MKTIIFLTVVSITQFSIFAQKQDQGEMQKRITAVEDKQKEIMAVSSHFSLIEVIIAVLGSLVGIVALSLPLIIYFFQLRPAQEALAKLDDFDKKLEEKLIAYLKQEEEKRINKAIDDILNPNDTVSYNAMQYLSFNQFYDFSENQLFKVYSHLRSGIDNQKKSALAMILTKKQTTFADQYFREIIQSKEYGNLFYPALNYFARAGFVNYLPEIGKYIRTANNAAQNSSFIGNNYVNIAVNIINISQAAFEILINSEDINNGLDSKIRKQVKDGIQGICKHHGVEATLNASKLAKDL